MIVEYVGNFGRSEGMAREIRKVHAHLDVEMDAT